MQRMQRTTGVSSEVRSYLFLSIVISSHIHSLQNKWVQHLMLSQEDGKSDPSEKLSVRAIQGMDSVTYLDPGVLTSSLSYVTINLLSSLLCIKG